MRVLAEQRPRWGSPRLHWLLAREGLVVNHKRTERLCREERLAVARRRRKKRVSIARVLPPAPQGPNERWSMDFVCDTLATGRPFRAFTLVDDFTRECPVIHVDTHLPSECILAVLDDLARTRGLPQALSARRRRNAISTRRSGPRPWIARRPVSLIRLLWRSLSN